MRPSMSLRLAGVGLRGQPRPRHAGHALDRLEQRRRAHAAVEADDVGARSPRAPARTPPAACRRGCCRPPRWSSAPPPGSAHTLRTAATAARISFRSRKVSMMNRSTPPVGQRLRPVRGSTPAPRRRRPCPRARCGCRAGRWRRPRTPGRARRCPRDLRALGVDRLHLVAEAEAGQLDAVGAERVGLDDVRAGLHVLGVHLGDQGRLRQVQPVEAAVDEDALGVQQRAHRAVADQHALVDRVEEGTQGHGGQVSSRSYCQVAVSISRYDRPTGSRPIDRTPCRTLVAVHVVMAGQVHPRPQRREHLVDGRLPHVLPPAAHLHEERAGGLVRQEEVDPAQPLAGVDLDAQEMAPLVVARQAGELARRRRRRASAAAGPRAARSYQVGAKVPPRPTTVMRAELQRHAVGQVAQVRRCAAGPSPNLGDRPRGCRCCP